MDSKQFDFNKYTSNSSKKFVLEVDLEYPKELLHNGYPLAPDKIEIKRDMLSEYKLNIADLCNISIDNVKKLVPNFFDKKSMCLIMRTWNFNQSYWLKLSIELNTQKRIEAEKKQ